jgi:hypothetical protein
MCGRYTLTADLKKVARKNFGLEILDFGLGIGDEEGKEGTHPRPSKEGNSVWRPRYNIAPTKATEWTAP